MKAEERQKQLELEEEERAQKRIQAVTCYYCDSKVPIYVVMSVAIFELLSARKVSFFKIYIVNKIL